MLCKTTGRRRPEVVTPFFSSDEGLRRIAMVQSLGAHLDRSAAASEVSASKAFLDYEGHIYEFLKG
jgi:hypothetical protein